MRRIALIGNGGGGKSTVARALGRHLRIPVHEVDEVHLLELVTKDGRGTKLVHLRSPREMARWLGDVTRSTAGVAD